MRQCAQYCAKSTTNLSKRAREMRTNRFRSSTLSAAVPPSSAQVAAAAAAATQHNRHQQRTGPGNLAAKFGIKGTPDKLFFGDKYTVALADGGRFDMSAC
eukprot:225022-Pleurochrysis_carterae.AAC.1